KDLVKAGLNVVIFNQRSVEEILNFIQVLSSIVGVPEKGERLVASLEKNLQEIRKAAPKRRPKVYFEEWDEPMISGIRWVSELVEIAGGEDIFRDLSTSQAASGRIHDGKGVIERKPDIILGSWCGKKCRPERVKARDGWNAVPGVKNDQLFEIKSVEILQPGPAALTDGVRHIHEILAAWAAGK